MLEKALGREHSTKPPRRSAGTQYVAQLPMVSQGDVFFFAGRSEGWWLELLTSLWKIGDVNFYPDFFYHSY